MIITENMTLNGKALIKTYSNSGYMIERDGVRYSEAIDPADLNREYTETDEPIEGYTGDATEADYRAALAEFGVSV